MCPLLGSIGGISEYSYRGNLDDYPDDFFFENIDDAEPGVSYTSGITTITGINNKIRVSVSAGASFSINGGAFSTSPTFIREGDELRLSLTTIKVGLATDFSRENNVDVSVGKRITTWTVKTRAKNDNLVPVGFNTVTDLPVGVATTSNIVNIVGLETGYSVPVSVTGFGASISINGGAFTSSGEVFNGDNFYINHPATDITNQNSYGATRPISVFVGTYSTAWVIFTELADLTPDQFSFTDVTEADIDTSYTSNLITVSGINSITTPKFAADISIFGARFEYNINGGTFTNQSGTVGFGDTIRLRATTDSNYSTTSTGILVISGISSSWNVTTKAQPFDTVPDAFNFSSVSSASLSTQYTSDSITLSGMTAGFSGTASISGGEFRVVRSGSTVRDYSSSSTLVQLGDVITLRRTSSSNYSNTLTSTLSVSGSNINGTPGTTSASWTITTQSAPAPAPTPTPIPTPTCTVIATSSTYGVGFRGYILYGNGFKQNVDFISRPKDGYNPQSVTTAGGLATTYGSIASVIFNVYNSLIKRWPETVAYDGWMGQALFNSSIKSLTDLQNAITLAYTTSGEKQIQIDRGGVAGVYDNCDTRRL